MTLFAHNQIVPISLVTILSVFAMMWATNFSLETDSDNSLSAASPTQHEQDVSVEKNSCYKYLRKARTAGSSYWWQKYKSCIAAI